MEGRGFDDLARMLGTAGARRALLIGLGGLAAARLAGLGRETGAGVGPGSLADAPPAAAKKKKKKKCKPACVNGYTCVKVKRRKRECQCLAPGTACGEFCCPAGQTCSGGACVGPSTPTPTATATATATGTAAPPTLTPLPTETPVAPTATSVAPTPSIPSGP